MNKYKVTHFKFSFAFPLLLNFRIYFDVNCLFTHYSIKSFVHFLLVCKHSWYSWDTSSLSVTCFACIFFQSADSILRVSFDG